MAYISFKPKGFFSPFLYPGSASTWNAHTGLGFQPDMTWHKSRTSTGWWGVADAVRGVDADPGCKSLYTNANNVEETSTTEYLDGYQSDGFTTGVNGSFGSNGNNYSSYCWKMGTTSGLSGGTITPTGYSINTSAKQGVYAYTGNYTSGATIAHGLGQAPDCLLIKNRSTANNWAVYSKSMGNTKYQILNTTGTIQTGTAFWNDTSPTSTVFSIGNNVSVNTSGDNYIAYAFCNVPGYFSEGQYEGNSSSSNGPFLYLGFRPAMIMIKNHDQAEAWQLFDSARLGYNIKNYRLYPNDSAVEAATTTYANFTANGFKITTGSGSSAQHDINGDGQTYLYMAWSEEALVSSNNVPGLAR